MQKARAHTMQVGLYIILYDYCYDQLQVETTTTAQQGLQIKYRTYNTRYTKA